MKKPRPCTHDNVIRMRPAETVFGPLGVLFARYRCTDCKCEWDDPTEKPSVSPTTIYRVKFDGSKTEVIRNGIPMKGLQSFKAESSIDSETRVTLTEIAEVEPM